MLTAAKNISAFTSRDLENKEQTEMSIWKLRLSMLGTLTAIIALSTLVFTAVLFLVGVFDIVTLGILVVGFNVLQWLISPYLISALYRARELKQDENPKLYQTVQNLSQKSGIRTPKIFLAQIPLPNAFAYGSPLTGNRMAVTSGLMKTLDDDEIEAVIGHELGHLKHRDVQTMMFVSILPALFYYMGYSFLISAMYGGQKREGNGGGAILGLGFMAFSFVLNLFILNLSRTREYYADRHSASIVPNGSQKLSTGLAKIVNASKNIGRNKNQTKNLSAFKALFITDPERAHADSAEIAAMSHPEGQKLVQEILSRRLTTLDRIAEVLSTHPNIIKRLKALQELD
jgi:heat shock protein HtpX